MNYNHNISLTDTMTKNADESSSGLTRGIPAAVSKSIPLGTTLQTSVDNYPSQKLQAMQKPDIDPVGFNQAANIAYVPIAFPSYPPNYAPNAVYGYAPNGVSSFPMYSYNHHPADKEKEVWTANHFTQSRIPVSYVPVNPHLWNGDGKNQVLSVPHGFQNPVTLQNSVGQSVSFPNALVYQNGNGNSLKDMQKTFQDTSISGHLLGQKSPSSGFNTTGLDNLLPTSLAQVMPTEAVSNGLHNGLKNESSTVPFPAAALDIQNGSVQNEIMVSNGVPLVVPTLFHHFPPEIIPTGIVKGIPSTLAHAVHPNLVPAYVGKTPVINPQITSNPADNITFVNVQNDRTFDPLTQAPLLWNNLTRTPLVGNSLKDDDIYMMPLPREIQPPQFLNIYPITAVPMPTLIATSPIVTSPVKNKKTEDSAKNKKYACKYCSKRFSRPSSLQTHTYSHTGERPFPCTLPNCGRSFSVLSNLRRHLHVCQKNLSKRVQLNDFIQQSAASESTNTSVTEEKSPKENDSIPDVSQVTDSQTPQLSNDAASSSNFTSSNSDARSTDSGSEETKNDSGLGGSVSSKGSRSETNPNDYNKLQSNESITNSNDQVNVGST